MKYIIADDVIYARKSIEKMVLEWDSEAVILANCENGQQVLDQMKREVPDVLITDICMPPPSGLELAKGIHSKWKEVKIIIVTGHALFEYANEAINYGVAKYLLKPLQKQQLHETLEELRLYFAQTKEKNDAMLQAKRTVHDMTLLHFLEGNATKPDTLPPVDNGCLVVILQTSGENIHAMQLELLRFFGVDIVVCKNILREDQLIALLYAPAILQGVHLETIVVQALESFIDTMQGRYEFSAAVSNIVYRAAQLPLAYENAINNLCWRILDTEQKVFSHVEQKSHVIHYEADVHAICKLIDANNWSKAQSTWTSRVSAHQNLLYMKKLYRGLVTHCFMISSHSAEQDGRIQIHRSLSSFANSAQLWQYLKGLVVPDAKVEEYLDLSQKDDVVSEIKEFIEKNYYCEITLQELADSKYFLNANYLSRLFKSKTGMGFSRYLLKVRMEKARDLLEEGELNIGEIAFAVGYTSTSYFIQKFKNEYGYTPGNSPASAK